ncbi:hypothetical protein [Marinobacter sp. CHS3-4]|uniref:capsular polysaccharide export protein, LipB/KpsS family n=1 Tax=Marinobacter sp. CHS3-4 TaxID=3045174 RepID=UPI0024B4C9AD|nr:hypothetical protein [Marinobacter sp. CHS3-4]MDI9246613.1 hypothetical protein [Marinobacter sp. CHS3-4]
MDGGVFPHNGFMNILFVSLSSSRQRYYSNIKRFAPEGYSAFVEPGYVSLYSLRRLFVKAPRSVSDSLGQKVKIQLRRQEINYPSLFSSGLLSRWYRKSLYLWEKLRFFSLVDLIRSRDANTVVVWNGQKPPYSTVVSAADYLNIPVWYFENGHFANTTTLDPRGVNACSSVVKIPLSLITDGEDRPIAKSKEASNTKIKVLVPLQIESDTQLVSNSDWVSTSQDLVHLVADCMEGVVGNARRFEVIVRHHPWGKAKVEVPDRRGVSVDDETSLEDQLEMVDLVITINSTVGLKALERGLPVCVLAPSVYSRPEVCSVAQNKEQLMQALKELFQDPMQKPKAGAYLQFLSEVYSIPGDWHYSDDLPPQHFQHIWSRLLRSDQYSAILRRANVG